MFTPRIGTWFGIVIVYIVISLLLSRVPYIGGVAQWLLTPVFVGGIMLGCNSLRQGESLRLAHLFDGFTGPHFIPLLMVGVFNMLLTLVAVCVGLVVIAGGIGLSGLMNLGSLAADPWQMWRGLGLMSFMLFAVVLAVVAVIAMANWFAPALIVLQEARAMDAMRSSFRACMRNWAPFLVYGAIGIAIAIGAMCVFAALAGVIGIGALMAMFDGNGNWGSMIFGLAALVVGYVALTVVIAPVIFGSTYAGYRDTLAVEKPRPSNPA